MNIKLKPSLENLKIQIPKDVCNPLQWGAFPIVIENPTDSEIEVPITVKSESFEKVKISQDFENPFQTMPSEREDRLTVKLNPNEKRILAVVFGENELRKRKDNVILQIGDKSWSIRAEINSRTASGNFFATYAEATVYEHLHDLIKNKGFIAFEGKKVKILPIEGFVIMINYDPRVHGWGFNNDQAASNYSWTSKTGLKNFLYSARTYSPLVFHDLDSSHLGSLTYLLFLIKTMILPESGVCYGMTYTSGLYYQGILDIPKPLGDITNPRDTITIDGKKVPVEDLIVLYHSSQYLEDLQQLCMESSIPSCEDIFSFNIKNNGASHSGEISQKDVYNEIYKYLSNDRVVELKVRFSKGGHSILIYGIASLSDNKYIALSYDPNYPRETRVIVLDKTSTKPAIYSDPSKGNGYVFDIMPIDSIKPYIPQINGIAVIIDPVQEYTIKTLDGQVLDIDKYSMKKMGYDIVLLPKGDYIFNLRGDDYFVVTLTPTENGLATYALTANGGLSTDELCITTDSVTYKTGNEKKVVLEIGYSSLNLSDSGTVKGDLSMKENQAIMVTNPEQVAKGELEVRIDTNGDGKPDKEEVFTSKGESKGTTITQSSKATSATQTVPETSKTTTSQKGGICGPAVLVGLAILPLLARRRKM